MIDAPEKKDGVSEGAPTEQPAEAAPQAEPGLKPEVQEAEKAQKAPSAQEVLSKQADAQAALLKLRAENEQKCAEEINKVLAKYGCELTVGHSVKVTFRQVA